MDLLLRLPHLDQLHIEDQGLVGADVAAGTARAVGEFGGDKKTVFGPFLHELNAFGPAGDHLVQREFDGLFAAIRAVKDGAVDEGAFIVDFNGIGGFGAFARAGREDLILKAAGGDDDAFFLGVVREEFFTFGECDVRHDGFGIGLIDGQEASSKCGLGKLGGGEVVHPAS